jgi:hypothetical protein
MPAHAEPRQTQGTTRELCAIERRVARECHADRRRFCTVQLESSGQVSAVSATVDASRGQWKKRALTLVYHHVHEAAPWDWTRQQQLETILR